MLQLRTILRETKRMLSQQRHESNTGNLTGNTVKRKRADHTRTPDPECALDRSLLLPCFRFARASSMMGLRRTFGSETDRFYIPINRYTFSETSLGR